MKKVCWFLGAAAVVGTLCFVAARSNARPVAQSAADKIERGRYLVQQVAMCGECHTPRNEKSEPIPDQTLQGASTFFKPLQPIADWAEYTPPLAGFPGFTDDQAITFLTTGKDPSGQLANPPMPQYRLTREDATAVLAYLKSLAPPKK
jgi:mono/diheme cytochrome c family protein